MINDSKGIGMWKYSSVFMTLRITLWQVSKEIDGWILKIGSPFAIQSSLAFYFQ